MKRFNRWLPARWAQLSSKYCRIAGRGSYPIYGRDGGFAFTARLLAFFSLRWCTPGPAMLDSIA